MHQINPVYSYTYAWQYVAKIKNRIPYAIPVLYIYIYKNFLTIEMIVQNFLKSYEMCRSLPVLKFCFITVWNLERPVLFRSEIKSFI
jgi:hypothetical protein